MRPVYGFSAPDPALASTFEVDARLLELIRFRAAHLHQCPGSMMEHQEQLRSFGESDERLLELSNWKTSSLFDARERAALALCDQITQDPDQPLPCNLMLEIRHFFTKSEIVGLTICVMAVEDWISAYA